MQTVEIIPSLAKYSSARRKLAGAAAVAMSLAGLPLAHAAVETDTFSYNFATTSAGSSTAGSADIAVSGTYAVGEQIRFTGTAATSNPFGTSATNYYVVSVGSGTIRVATAPGGSAINAVNTISGAVTAVQFADFQLPANWTANVPNSSNQIASFGSTPSNFQGVSIVGNNTLYGLTFNGGGNSDLGINGGGVGTSFGTLTFATNDATVPTITQTTGTTRLINLGSSGTLKIAGNQGLDIRALAQSGTFTGSGLTATAGVPAKNLRITNVDWSGFSGGITVDRGELAPQGNNQLGNLDITVGTAYSTTNSQLAGLSAGGTTLSESIGNLNGNALGRVYGQFTLTVGANNATGGDFGGIIGQKFDGTATPTTLIKTGTGTQTISGNIVGTGTVTVSGGVLKLSGANSFAPTSGTVGTTVNSGGTLLINGTYNQGSGINVGRIVVNSGGTLGGSGSVSLSDVSGGTTGVSIKGTFAPGDSGIGTFTVNDANSTRSAWAFEGGGTLSYDLGAGLTSDQLALTGGKASSQIFFNNNVINFTDLTAGTLSMGQYTLIASDAANVYSGLTLDANNYITAGLTIGTGLSAYSTSLQQVGNNIVLNVAAVPEPASLGMLGVAGLLAARRRRRA
ncbi:MAG: beta strand repeat-containing protein [Tepidisphaeraceae bacterium]